MHPVDALSNGRRLPLHWEPIAFTELPSGTRRAISQDPDIENTQVMIWRTRQSITLPSGDRVLIRMGTSGESPHVWVLWGDRTVADVASSRRRVEFLAPDTHSEAHLFWVARPNPGPAWTDDGDRSERTGNSDPSPPGTLDFVGLRHFRGVTEASASGDGAVLISKDGLRLGVAMVSDHVVRIRLSPGNPEAISRIDEVCLSSPPSYLPCSIRVFDASVAVLNGSVSVRVERATGEMAISGTNGEVAVAGVRLSEANGSAVVRWNLSPEDEIYGLGENAVSGMNKRATTEQIWVSHSFVRCDKPIPFMLCPGRYGAYLHSSHGASVYVDTAGRGGLTARVEAARIDLFFILSPSIPAMVRAYTTLTGRSPLPPRWAFGYWQSSRTAANQEKLLEIVDEFERRGIPIDVLAIDPGWQKPGLQSWQWHPDRFPDPVAFQEKLRERNTRLCLWTAPFVNGTSGLHDEAVAGSYLMMGQNSEWAGVDWWMGTGAGLVDFDSDRAARWWGEKATRHAASGTEVLKVDGGDGNETRPGLRSASGRGTDELHNLYPILFAKAVSDGMKAADPRRRWLTWIRTGYSGIQRYPCAWGGDQPADFSGTRTLIRAGQQAGLMGIPFWSHDLGGFKGTPSEEYFIRSCQWGLLSPLARAHGKVLAPWEVSERAAAIVGDWIRLRYRLLPTLYSYAWDAHRTGDPIMRAMAYSFQDDPRARSAEFQYMLGPNLLIAPIVQPSEHVDLTARRNVYLPAGVWCDFWSGETYTGPTELEIVVSIERIPVFVRAGAVIVMAPLARRASDLPTSFEFHLWPGDDGTFDLYQDDGISTKHEEGSFAVTRFEHRGACRPQVLISGKRKGTFGSAQVFRSVAVVHGAAQVHSHPFHWDSARPLHLSLT